MAIGDVVIVHDEQLPRSFWKLGHIQQLIVGKDGETRGATIKVVGKNQRCSTLLNRPLRLLYPLEISHFVETARDSSDSDRPEDNEPLTALVPCRDGFVVPLRFKVKLDAGSGFVS